MRQPITWIATALTALAIAMTLVVTAQEETEVPAPLQSILPITEDVRYEVGVGDTLDAIGAIFDVSVDCLKDVNALTDENQIFVGQQLIIQVSCPPYVGLNYVPFPREVSLGAGGGGVPTYTVQPADTLSDIAFLFDISVISLQEYNGIANPNDIFVGQILEIPPGAPSFGLVPPADGSVIESGGGEGDLIYVVQPGDTLDVVGAFYNADAGCIAEVNGIVNPRLLQPRITILIPQQCAPYIPPNTIGGRILPLAGVATVAPTTVITVTPRTILEPTATFLPSTLIATADPNVTQILPSPTAEILATNTPTVEPTTVEPTDVPPTETPAPTKTPIEPTTEPLATVAPTSTSTQEPTESVVEPAAATEEPTEATVDSAAATEEPTEATVDSAAATEEPTEATVDSAAATEEPTEATVDSAATEEPNISASPTPETLSAQSAESDTNLLELLSGLIESQGN